MHYQRARILVNWKFLSTSKDVMGINECWSIVIEASFEIMRLQHRMVEEFEVFKASRPTGMIDSCFIDHGYFLAASIACFIVQHHKDRLSTQDLLEVQTLLEKSLAIWSSSKDLSREASKVVSAMRVVLGKPTESSLLTPVDTEASSQAGGKNPIYRKMRAELTCMRAVADIFCRSQTGSSYNSFFDDLSMMMTDFDTTGFPSLPSISMVDCWPLHDGGFEIASS